MKKWNVFFVLQTDSKQEKMQRTEKPNEFKFIEQNFMKKCDS